MLTACWVNRSIASIPPVASSSRRALSNPASSRVRSPSTSGVSPSARVSRTAWWSPRAASSFFIPSSSSRANIFEMSGRNGLYAGPRNPGRALLRTSGRPCIRSTNAGTGSAGEPRSLATTDPIAGRPPTACRSRAGNPDWHWKASCAPADPTRERTNANRSARPATFGISSETWRPGILVAIGSNSPRTSRGASGFGSMVSCCGGPPSRWTLMTDLTDDRTPAAASARSRPASVSPPNPAAPATSACLRVRPSQCRYPRPRSVSTGNPLRRPGRASAGRSR